MAECNTAKAPRGEPFATLQPGISIGRTGGGCGTLGLFVVDGSCNLCILSALHVLRGSASGNPVIFQPAPDEPDGNGASAEPVARLFRPFRRLDAGLAVVDDDVPCALPPFGSGVVLEGIRKWEKDDILELSGRTSGLIKARATRSRTSGIPAPGFLLEPVDQSPLPGPGDSGAVWYDPVTREAVGLHHGLTESKQHAIAGDLAEIKRKLNIDVWDGSIVTDPGAEC